MPVADFAPEMTQLLLPSRAARRCQSRNAAADGAAAGPKRAGAPIAASAGRTVAATAERSMPARRRRGDRRVERQQHRRPLESGCGRDLRSKHLVVRVRGHDEAFGAAEQILGLPRLGAVAGHGELLRELLANRRNLGVDAGDETRRDPARVRRVALPLRVHVTAIPHEAREAIAVDVVRAENLGEPSLSRAAPQIDLEQPVLRLDETLCEEEVVGVLRVDMWNAPPVADDAYLVGEAGDLQNARRLRKPPVGRREGRRPRMRVACAAGQHDRQPDYNRAVQRHLASPSMW